MFKKDTSGQAHTVESIAAGALILATIIFAVQSTAITPLTVSTSHQYIETQQKKMADGVLENAKYTEGPNEMSDLEEMILYWDVTNQTFHNASSDGYLGHYPDTAFGDRMGQTFDDREIATNVYATYSTNGAGSGTEQIVHMGEPSDNAMSATTTVVLYNDQEITAPGSHGEIGNNPGYFAPDAFPDSNIYNVVEVRVVVWRI